MHNKCVLIFFFPVLRKEKLYKTKATEWLNELKPTENELKMKICLLKLYLNHFNENKLMFGSTLNNLFCFFCGIIKLICELRNTFFINLRLRQILILRLSVLFFKNLRSAAGKFAYSAVSGNTSPGENSVEISGSRTVRLTMFRRGIHSM